MHDGNTITHDVAWLDAWLHADIYSLSGLTSSSGRRRPVTSCLLCPTEPDGAGE